MDSQAPPGRIELLIKIKGMTHLLCLGPFCSLKEGIEFVQDLRHTIHNFLKRFTQDIRELLNVQIEFNRFVYLTGSLAPGMVANIIKREILCRTTFSTSEQ